MQQTVYPGQLTLAASERLHGDLLGEEQMIKDGFKDVISWVQSILIPSITGKLASHILPAILLSRKTAIMQAAESTRQSQN